MSPVSFQKTPFYFKLAMILLMLGLICLLLYYGQDIIIPFALSILLAIVLIPGVITAYLRRRTKGAGR